MYHKVNDNKRGLIPYPLTALFISPSRCGKTTLLENFIYNNWLPFKNLYVFSKLLEQNAYQDMIKRF